MKVSYETRGEGKNSIVFLHGIGSGKEGWAAQRSAIVDAGWRFVAIDAPGFGGTTLPDGPGFASHVEAIRICLDELGINNAVLCGHSMGGMSAQEFVAAHSERVSGLVLSGTSPAFGRPDGDFQKEFLRQRLEPFERGETMASMAPAFASGLVGSNASDNAIAEIAAVMTDVPFPAYKLALETLSAFDQRANLTNINVPVLVIAGDEDANAPAGMQHKMAQKIPDADYVELEKTGHMAPVENTKEFNRELIKFLSRIAQTG